MKSFLIFLLLLTPITVLAKDAEEIGQYSLWNTDNGKILCPVATSVAEASLEDLGDKVFPQERWAIDFCAEINADELEENAPVKASGWEI
jgi:hypothetical protein